MIFLIIFLTLRVLHDLAAIYGNIWTQPIAMADIFVNGGLSLKQGALDDIFPKMIEEENIPIKYNFEVEVNLVFIL